MDTPNGNAIKVFTPQTIEEFQAFAPYFELLLSFDHLFLPKQVVYDAVLSDLGNLTMFFYGDIVLGCFTPDRYKRSAELHGILRPDLDIIFGRQGAAALRAGLIHHVLDALFRADEKDKVYFKCYPSDRRGVGFAWQYKFKRLRNKDKGKLVFVLSRDDYYARMNGKETKGTGV